MNTPAAVGVGIGAEQGLRAATCRGFAREGHHVLLAGRTPAKIERVAQTIACGRSPRVRRANYLGGSMSPTR